MCPLGAGGNDEVKEADDQLFDYLFPGIWLFLSLWPAHSGGQWVVGSCICPIPALREVSGIPRDGAS